MNAMGKRLLYLLALTCSLASIPNAFAVVLVTNISDTGTLVTTTYAAPASTSVSSVPTPYGSGGLTITPVTNGYKFSFAPSSGFFASANNLAGGKTSIFAGTLAFDVIFDSPVRLTANIFEDGIYSVSGPNGRVGVNTADLASGVMINQIDNLLVPERIGNSFRNNAIVAPLPTGLGGTFPSGSGTWSLFDQVTGFSKNYTKYHVVVDNDLIAESLLSPNQAPGFAAIAKKDFVMIFQFDGSNGGPIINPEPASVGVLFVACAGLVMRRRGAALRRPRRAS